MITQVKEFVTKFKETYPGPYEQVLEVGSRDDSGTGGVDIRAIFTDSKEYIGTDMLPGKNVDQVVNGHNLIQTFGENRFDLVLCLDTLEHAEQFWGVVFNMKYVLKRGGWLVMSAPSIHCPLHNHPSDYWRFMPEGLKSLFDGFAEVHVEEGCWDPKQHGSGNDEVMGWGQKQ